MLPKPGWIQERSNSERQLEALEDGVVHEDGDGDYDVEEGNDMDAEGEDEDGVHDAKRRRIELPLHLPEHPSGRCTVANDIPRCACISHYRVKSFQYFRHTCIE